VRRRFLQVGGCAIEAIAKAADLACDQFRLLRPRQPQRHVGLATVQRSYPLFPDQFDPDARVSLVQPKQLRRDQYIGERRRRTDRDFSAQARSSGLHGTSDGERRFFHRNRRRRNALAVVGQLIAARPAIDQFQPGIGLERGDAAGDGGVIDPEHPCRGG
jgi:hypothetical protein